MENTSDDRIENGFILASRLGRSDPGQVGTHDQPQRMLRITRSGTKLWKVHRSSDLILAVAYDGEARRVLQAAMQRLNQHNSGGHQA